MSENAEKCNNKLREYVKDVLDIKRTNYKYSNPVLIKDNGKLITIMPAHNIELSDPNRKIGILYYVYCDLSNFAYVLYTGDDLYHLCTYNGTKFGILIKIKNDAFMKNIRKNFDKVKVRSGNTFIITGVVEAKY